MKQISLSTLIYLIALVEGINLMSFELITSRVMAIAFGSTMKVWANLLCLTLLFLALGYFLGEKI